MKPTVELLVQDIEDETEDIENFSSEDSQEILKILNQLYFRCINLNEEDFETKEVYERTMQTIRMLMISDAHIIRGLEYNIDSATQMNFSEVKKLFDSISSALRNAW